jgi:hypothetical protein
LHLGFAAGIKGEWVPVWGKGLRPVRLLASALPASEVKIKKQIAKIKLLFGAACFQPLPAAKSALIF